MDPRTGAVRVAGRSKPATMENPHFKTGSARSSIDATAAAVSMAAIGDAPEVVASAFIDGFGRAVSAAPLTAADRGMIDAAGNYVRTEKKTFEDLFGGDRLTDLILLAGAERDALSSLSTLETSDVDGRSVTLAITGHAYRDFHFVRGGNASNAPLYIPAPAAAVAAASASASASAAAAAAVADAAPAGGTAYDLAMRVLVLHTTNVRFPAAVAASIEPLSDDEKRLTPAKNVSAVLGDDAATLGAVLRAVYATDAELNASDTPFGPIAPGRGGVNAPIHTTFDPPKLVSFFHLSSSVQKSTSFRKSLHSSARSATV